MALLFPFFSFWEEEEAEKEGIGWQQRANCACCALDSKAESVQIQFTQALL